MDNKSNLQQAKEVFWAEATKASSMLYWIVFHGPAANPLITSRENQQSASKIP